MPRLAASQPRSLLTSLQLDNPTKNGIFPFSKSFSFISAIAATVVLSACGGGAAGDAGAGGSSVNLFSFDETVTLQDGGSHSVALNKKGTYAAEINSNTHGVTVQWTGASEGNCTAASAESKAYSQTCTITNTGKITITNPAAQAGQEVVTIKIRQR